MPSVQEVRGKVSELEKLLRQLKAIPGVASTERERDRERKKETRSQQRVVTIEKCEDPQRRKDLESSDERWLRWYFPALFWYDFTIQQKEMIAAIARAISCGDDQAIAASRGEGKTKICERVLLKKTLEGAVKLSVLFAASGAMAVDSLQSIMMECEENERLAADYKEVCTPVRALENVPQRAHSLIVQGYRPDNGEWFEPCPCRFSWCGQEIVFPRVPGSNSAAAIIATRGLDAAVRGLNKLNRRVDVAVIDDPDTEDTARSPDQARKLELRIDRAIGGLGGQQRGCGRVIITTIQSPIAVSYRFTDPKQKPAMKGKRYRFLLKPPDNTAMWDEFIALRRQDWHHEQHGITTRLAHEFYESHRESMDAGAEVSNPHRKKPEHLSALEFYYEEAARKGIEYCLTELDNDPPDEASAAELLSRDQIAAKVNGYDRGLVPSDATHLSCFIDVQGRLLYWAVAAWRPDFTGYVVNYGAWPAQRRNYYTLADAVPVISDRCQGGLEAQLHAALTQLVNELCGKEWEADGGGTLKIGRCLIDANWGESTPTVYSFCRQSPHAAVLLPTHGRGVKASGSPILMWPQQDGETIGLNWRVRKTTKKHAPVRHGVYDTNFWKSFVHARLLVPMGGVGCLSLFRAEPAVHRMLADHLHAEYPVPVESQGRKVSEWQQRPDRPDNHLFDCLVGNCVAGSILGAALPSDVQKVKKPRKSLQAMGRRAG